MKPVKFGVSWECKWGIVSNWACWCILTTFRTDYILVTVCWFSSFWRHFELVKQVRFWGLQDFLERTGGMAKNFTCWCILTTFGTDFIWVMVCWFSSFWHHIETGEMCSFQALSWQCMGVMVQKLSCSSLFCDVPQKWKGQIIANEDYPSTEWGYPCQLCSQTFLVL